MKDCCPCCGKKLKYPNSGVWSCDDNGYFCAIGIANNMAIAGGIDTANRIKEHIIDYYKEYEPTWLNEFIDIWGKDALYEKTKSLKLKEAKEEKERIERNIQWEKQQKNRQKEEIRVANGGEPWYVIQGRKIVRNKSGRDAPSMTTEEERIVAMYNKYENQKLNNKIFASNYKFVVENDGIDELSDRLFY